MCKLHGCSNIIACSIFPNTSSNFALILFSTHVFPYGSLLFQTSYPRTACVRKGWVFRQLVKLIIFTGLMGFIVEQVSLNFLFQLAFCALLFSFDYCGIMRFVYFCSTLILLSRIHNILWRGTFYMQ